MNTSQLARFVRLFVMALCTAVIPLVAGNSRLTLAAVMAVVVPALETAYRALFPVMPAKPAPPVPPATPPTSSPPAAP